MADRQWRPSSVPDDGRRGTIPRSESMISAATGSRPPSARSSLRPGSNREGCGDVDDSLLPYDDGDGYDPSQALLRAPNENFKVGSCVVFTPNQLRAASRRRPMCAIRV